MPTKKGVLLPLDAIQLGPRCRQNLGNLDALAQSMREQGLLQPIAVTPDYQLIAGERRLRAAQLLGWKSIPVYVVRGLDDAGQLLRAERDENVCRLSLAPSELVNMGRRLEELEKPK